MKSEISLCWTCKHGICIKETDFRYAKHDPDPEEAEEPQIIFDAGSGEDEPIEHHFEETSVKGICYWRPPGLNEIPPFMVSSVESCSRYEKNED